jgi:hypothetical protein
MKLSKADTARHLNISRQTLYEWIKQGRISVSHDGTIDSAEVARLSGSANKVDVVTERQSRQILTSVHPDTVDVYRPMIDLLSKYPPAKPGALDCEPLKAAIRGR